jgi:large subunit ribosomal protein L4
MEINVVNMKNEPVEKLEVPDVIATATPRESLVHELVRQYQAGARQGTSATKNRASVSGSGRKLWRQKGTGRARIGSVRSPLWRHGGAVFGPQPRDYSYSMPAKKRTVAYRAVLASKMKENLLLVVDEMRFAEPKTKAARELLHVLEIAGSKTLFVDSAKNTGLQLSLRNLQGAKFSTITGLNIVDLLKFRNIVFSKQAFTELTRALTK